MLSVSRNDNPERDLLREHAAHVELQHKNLGYLQAIFAERAAEAVAAIDMDDQDSIRAGRAAIKLLCEEIERFTLQAADNLRARGQLPRESDE